VENPRFLFLGGSADVVAATGVAAAAPPAVSAARAGASVARVTSLVGRLAVGAPAPAPGAVSSAASAALGEGGEGSHLSGGVRLPSLSSSSLPDDEYSLVPGEESPCCSRSRNSSLLRSRCSGSGRGRVGPRGVHGPYLQGTSKTSRHADIPRTGGTMGGGSRLTNGPTGSMVNAQRAASSFRSALRSMARRARVAAYSHGRRSGINRDYASATASASSRISKMRSGLSIRGTIRR
jgi:hypothetical protein